MHGILIIDKFLVNDDAGETRFIASSSHKTGGFAGEKNPMNSDNISRICRWYKGRYSFKIKKTHPEFKWQPRSYDHIIRNAESFKRIQNYIAKNVQNWKEDTFHSWHPNKRDEFGEFIFW